MHSSMMRTARLLPVSPSMHCARGCLVPGGASSQGGLLKGGYLLWGVSQHAMGQTPLWTEFLTHATENITLPQLRCER